MIQVKGLNKSFGKNHVLKEIDLDVGESDVVVLIGASGSGKSTLLRCLNFLELADSGEIRIDGKEVDPRRDDLNRIRQDVGMVFQHFNLFPHMNVLENVMEALSMLKRRTGNKQKQRLKTSSTKWDSPTKPGLILPNSPAGSNSGWPLPAHWP